MLGLVSEIEMGTPDDFRNFMDRRHRQGAFDTIKSYIDHAKESADAEVLVGGKLRRQSRATSSSRR
jgi:1-pyrroline-5-carboxylate dehydrogenase